jgi:hypothetical protein
METPWRTLLWGTLAAALAVTLVLKALDAHARNAGIHRRIRAAEAELDRIQRDQRRMRAEMKALSEDPLYLQSELDRSPAGRQREPIVEK